MSVISIIATLPIAGSTLLGTPTQAEETVNTNIKTEFEIQENIKIEDGKITLADDSQTIPKNFEGYVPVKNQEVINKWKSKQDYMWNSLPENKFVINASAYTAAADECGKSDGITASGIKVHKGTLACPPQYPFGTKVEIDGYGTFVCEDRGGAIKGNKFDIYMQTKSEAFAFGRRNLTAQVIN